MRKTAERALTPSELEEAASANATVAYWPRGQKTRTTDAKAAPGRGGKTRTTERVDAPFEIGQEH